MASIDDLAPLPYFGAALAPVLRAVGWLDTDAEPPRGTVTAEFFDRLRTLVDTAFQPFVATGIHTCTLCQFDGPSGHRNLFVPDGDVLLVCPELIVHYVAAHRYRPPEVFVDAVMRCPDPQSMEYRKAFLAAGGRACLQHRP